LGAFITRTVESDRAYQPFVIWSQKLLSTGPGSSRSAARNKASTHSTAVGLDRTYCESGSSERAYIVILRRPYGAPL